MKNRSARGDTVLITSKNSASVQCSRRERIKFLITPANNLTGLVTVLLLVDYTGGGPHFFAVVLIGSNPTLPHSYNSVCMPTFFYAVLIFLLSV